MLYVDRMDVLRRPASDLPVLRQITSVLGQGTWFNTVRPFCFRGLIWFLFSGRRISRCFFAAACPQGNMAHQGHTDCCHQSV